MSHIAKVNCIIRAEHLDKFGEAAAKLGGRLDQGRKTFKAWGGQNAPCVHAVHVPNSNFEVGLRYRAAGNTEEFDLSTDWYDGSVARAFGSEFVTLRDEYLALVAQDQLERRGYRVDREQVGQQIRLTAER
jgi:hypothetical protein